MKKKLKVGNVEFQTPFFAAPLAGITDGPFQKICGEMGAGLVYSEMVSAKGLWYSRIKIRGVCFRSWTAKHLLHINFSGTNRRSWRMRHRSWMHIKMLFSISTWVVRFRRL